MKKIILFLIISILSSCKKESKKPLIKEVNKDEIVTKNASFSSSIGDSLISQSDFVNEIANNSDIKLQRSNLSKIKYDYDKFISWDYNTIEEKQIGNISFKIQKENKKNDADIFAHITLSTYKNDQKIDILTIYKQENYAEALVAITQYFFIDSNLNLWTLEIDEGENGIKVVSWNQYKIENETGKIVLVKKNIENKNIIVNANEPVDDWVGKYFFEKMNRDELETSFNISINSLNSVSVIYVGDGEKPETYNNLKAEKVDDDKIKIVFNKKYGDMGIIYIQKNENDYFITGETISNINPGNDEYLIKKSN